MMIFFLFCGFAGYALATAKRVTLLDCVLPLAISVMAGVVFAPVSLFAGNLFSIGTCIGSGVFLSLSLFLHKGNQISGWYVVFPAVTFCYEILPIDLPTDIDNVIALGGSATCSFLACLEHFSGTGQN
jgi:hypothetical protein